MTNHELKVMSTERQHTEAAYRGTSPADSRREKKPSSEKEIQTAILREFGVRPELRIWRANVGMGRALDSDRITKFGINGQCDLSGIVRDGRRLEIEVKSATGKLSERQKFFAAMITKFGGVYVMARSVEDVYAGLAAAGVVLERERAVV